MPSYMPGASQVAAACEQVLWERFNAELKSLCPKSGQTIPVVHTHTHKHTQRSHNHVLLKEAMFTALSK